MNQAVIELSTVSSNIKDVNVIEKFHSHFLMHEIIFLEAALDGSLICAYLSMHTYRQNCANTS